jgi:phosphoribosylformimino-5-aminoimidazole carboxamide ribonucleotide (ProFAR) isomerase
VRALARWGATSAVVGRALAMSRFTLAEAQAAADAETPPAGP